MNIQMDTSKLKNVLEKAVKTVDNISSDVHKRFTNEVDKITALAVKKAPVDTGILRSEGKNQIKLSTLLQGTISFGGLATTYADIQHNNVFNHPKGGIDHYLFGNANSAWNTKREQELTNTIETTLQKKVNENLGNN